MLSSPWQKPVRGMQINPSHPLSRGLVGAWIFNEATGDKVFDLSGNGNHGTIYGADWVADGLDFVAASGDYVNCGNGASLNVTDAITIILETKPELTAGGTVDVFIEKKGSIAEWQFAWAPQDSKLRFYSQHLSPTISLSPTTPVTAGVWNHIILVWNGTDAIFYVNGDNVGSSGMTGTISNENLDLWIGKRTGYEFNGTIANTLIYNRAISASEAAWLNREPYAMFQQPISPASLYYEAVSGVVTGAELMAMLI